MSERGGELVGFAYGEELEGAPPRSRGYRLLAPSAEPWGAEVEALARRLQAAPYPDHWPAADLFCSILLADGRRLVGLARYGLADHTPGKRRGGLELIGVVAPGGLDVRSALAVYRWLRRRRAAAEDLPPMGGAFALAEVLAAAPPETSPGAPVPVLPVRLWQDGGLLFAAGAPADPDRHLALLEQAADPGWQWLPLVGADFPLQAQARLGPLVAWTPYLAAVAFRLDHKPSPSPPPAPARRSRFGAILAATLTLLFVGLLAANLWSLVRINDRLTAPPPPADEPPREAARLFHPAPHPAPSSEASRDRFIAALHQLLVSRGGVSEMDSERDKLLAVYENLAARNKDLRVKDSDVQGKVTVAAIGVLAGRSADRVEKAVRDGLSNKGFSDKLIKVACDHVREQLSAEIKDSP